MVRRPLRRTGFSEAEWGAGINPAKHREGGGKGRGLTISDVVSQVVRKGGLYLKLGHWSTFEIGRLIQRVCKKSPDFYIMPVNEGASKHP